MPTLRLLCASVLVALSGSLRLHIAFLFAGIPPKISLYCAAGLIIYATYTIDRAMGSKEDAVNKAELSGSNRKIGLTVALFMFMIGAGILARERIIVASLVPLFIGGLYSQGISIKGHRFSLKRGAGMKNLVIGLTWGGTMAMIVGALAGIVPAMAIFMFYGVKLFFNSVIYDMKDVRGDREAGIVTIPARYGSRNAKKLLLFPFLGLHCMMVILLLSGNLRQEWAILAYSFLSGLTILVCYNPEFELAGSSLHKYIREFFVDGESMTALIIRSVLTL